MKSCCGFACLLPMLALVSVSGCQSAPVGQHLIVVESVPSQSTVISAVYVSQENEQTVVCGKIKRTFMNCCDVVRGHIDIDVVWADNTVLDTISIATTPREIPRARSRGSHFRAVLPYVLDGDIRLRIAYHESAEMKCDADKPLQVAALDGP